MLKNHQEYLKIAPYSLSKEEKRHQFTEYINELTRYHYKSCPEYAQILNAVNYFPVKNYDLEFVPFLPVGLFKEFDLISVPKEKIVKKMTSSGTSGQRVSKIFLDSETSRDQQRCLSHIVNSFIGNKRRPLIIIDTELVKKDSRLYSARGAGIVGFLMFGRDVFFALNQDMTLRTEELKNFIAAHQEDKIIMFGYTYIVWQFFQKALENQKIFLNITDGELFHIGGWKKLQTANISVAKFRHSLQEVCGNIVVRDYYGMVEQLGSVFVECEYGHKHCSIFSDIITRREKDFSLCDFGEVGILELMSILPSSYPGHVILTEDEGRILGEDDCPCGRKGKYFEILGRIKQAEIRGCSDTYGQ